MLFAFQHAQAGDLMVKKSPAATIGALALALKNLFRADNEIQVTGVRMGEKMHETLLTREEKAAAVDMEGYFRIPADESDLNYSKYFSDGNKSIGTMKEYNSSNTRRLTAEDLEQTLLDCEYVADELRMWNKQ